MAANFDIEGHRGCRGLMPENTIAAFIKAVELGVTTLEMDAVITKDGQVVISHEPFFNHEISTTPNGDVINEAEEKSLNIYNMTYSHVQQYDVGLKPHPRFPNQQKQAAVKPLLVNVIDSVESYIKQHHLPPIQYNIETKTTASTDNVYHPAPKEFVDILMQVVFNKQIESRTIIQSFDIRTLQYLHTQYPTIQTAYLFEGISLSSLDKRLETLGFTPTIYSPAYQLVTKSVVEKCHSKGIKVIPWTVNDIKNMQYQIALGVDGLITDYPNLAIQFKK
jgi:glycerophosphoryl diester phosphodiesterase